MALRRKFPLLPLSKKKHENVFTRVKQSLCATRRIASMPGTLASQPFAVHWLLSCEQRSLPRHVGCMLLPNCHLRHRAFRLVELRYSRAISGRSLVQWLPPRGKAFYSRVLAQKHKFAESLVLPVALACAFLLANPYPPSPLTYVSPL